MSITANRNERIKLDIPVRSNRAIRKDTFGSGVSDAGQAYETFVVRTSDRRKSPEHSFVLANVVVYADSKRSGGTNVLVWPGMYAKWEDPRVQTLLGDLRAVYRAVEHMGAFQ
jgi:hypothetical protein